MNISQIEYLSAAVRFGSFAEAARQLHITPQAISKAVKALEQETGVELFHFDGKGVRASKRALDIAEHADAFLDSYVDLRTYMLCEARGGGRSHIAPRRGAAGASRRATRWTPARCHR